MDGFWLSFGLIFLAELGDKTQLVALTLATRFKAWLVLWAVLVATLLVHLLSVALGGLSAHFLPLGWVELLSGLAFIGFGAWTLRGDSLGDDDAPSRRLASPFLIVFVTFFLAELGDKTMLGTVTLAAGHPALGVWLGSSLGMVASDGLAIWLGQHLGKRLPERAVSLGAAAIFFLVGLVYAARGLMDLRTG
ncbi:MAG: TMEM165/GDT1 family protein [Pseudomonadota bacterium]